MPTTNPVPSTDPSDLLFNAGRLDEVVNGTANSFTDRLGVSRRTVAGMNADFDAQLADAESDLNVYRADAAASASEALGYLQTIRATSYGAYAEDPSTDPLGNPPTVGDEYFNTTANLLKRWNGTTWQASDINTANLAASSGSSLVGYDGGTVQDALDVVTGPNGAASVGYMPAGAGAIGTTVEEILGDIPTVKRFGAKCDGNFHSISSVDPFVTNAMVQAIDPGATTSNSWDWYVTQKQLNIGTPLHINGVMVTDRPLVIKFSTQILAGIPNFSEIRNIGAGLSAIKVGTTALIVEGARINGLLVKGVVTDAGRTLHGIEFVYAARIHLTQVVCLQNGGDGLHSSANQNSWGIRATNCRFTNNRENGVNLEHYYAFQKNANSFVNCDVNGNGLSVTGNTWTTNYNLDTVTATTGHGFKISGVSYNINGCTIEGNSGAGVYAGGSSIERLVHGLTITGTYIEPNLLAGIYIENTLPYCTDLLIAGNFRGSSPNFGLEKKSQYGQLYIEVPSAIGGESFYSYQGLKKGIKYLGDVSQATSLLIGGEMDTDQVFTLDGSVFSDVSGNSVKLFGTSNTNTLGSKSDDIDTRFLFSPTYYQLTLEYAWKRNGISSSSSCSVGILGYDYDDKLIYVQTTAGAVAAGTSLATVATSVPELTAGQTATVTVGPGDLAGWSAATKTSFNIYDTVLSNGVPVGTDYTHNYKSSSVVTNIVTGGGSDTFTLTGPCSGISAGTKVGLGNSGSGAFVYISSLAYSSENFSRKTYSADCSRIGYAKWIRRAKVYVAINGAADGEYIAIRKARISEIQQRQPFGTTAQRPTLSITDTGYQYLDTTLNKPIWWIYSAWKDAAGTNV